MSDVTPLENYALLQQHRKEIQDLWEVAVVRECGAVARVLDIEDHGQVFGDMLDAIMEALRGGSAHDAITEGSLKGALQKFSRLMTFNNIPPSETARAILCLRPVLLGVLRQALPVEAALDASGALNLFIDRLSLVTLDTYEQNRDTLLHDQQQVMEEISVPVVKVWDKILMIPLVGMLDSRRTQLMMESLLTAIENTQARVAILDISGIPIVDSLVARHLIMTATSTRLMGTECIITGISAKISKTIVELGVDLTSTMTRTSLADGLKLAFSMVETN